MSTVDRTSYEDAKRVSEHLLPDRLVRKKLFDFLLGAIIYSNDLKSDNWNLNLDKKGKFIRFNVGHAYCVQISREKVLILGLKAILKDDLGNRSLEIEFMGYQDNKKLSGRSLQSIPDCLVKVPDSVACISTPQNIISALPYLKTANQYFISYAINNTKQLTQMRNAHSIGFIEYLSKFSSKYVPNPIYAISEEISYLDQDIEISSEGINVFDNLIEGKVRRITVNSYERNPTARKKCIEHYGTTCCVCGFNFETMYGLLGKDYIHVHHLKPLSEINETYQVDPINDLRPVCPNCHAMIHRKNPPLTIEQMKDLLNDHK